MAIDILVPDLGESIGEATVATWFKQPGEAVAADETLLELETDKATLEVPSPSAGVLTEILVPEGEDVAVGAVLGRIEEGVAAAGAAVAQAKPEPAAAPTAVAPEAAAVGEPESATEASPEPVPSTPVGLDPGAVPRSGPGSTVTLADLRTFFGQSARDAVERSPGESRREERVKMSRLRRTIAARLKEAQNTAAILTTFNEADMSAVIDIRKRHRDDFEERYGVRLGFMSFFVKAIVGALKEMPEVNAAIDGDHIVYRHYYDIGIAVSTDSGLKVPVVRDCDRKSFAELEKDIAQLAEKARDGSLSLEEMEGGTFSITNGGVFGSLLSTPILNPPQSAILGLHKIQERPVVIDGQIALRPMMYLAMSYDHRLIDGRESVTFLVRVKELIEKPQRLLLDA
jgi:2-oxoglutarate dehydrogenase E2 component (dihydrolipoamide succinyltransferase)